MKLSKQERIAVLIVAVLIILGLGVFLFIVPKFQAIGTDSAALVNKKIELKAAQDRADTRTQLAEDIVNAYKDGKDKADMFFEEMKPYEADQEIREFLDYCKDNDVNVFVDSLTIDPATVSSLGVTFFEEPEITYDLKTAAQGSNGEASEAEQRMAILQQALASTQSVGSINVSFTVTALNNEDMLKFVDIINNYKKDSMRKAIRLSSALEMTFDEIIKKYADVISEDQLDLLFEARKQLATDTKTDAPDKEEIEKELGLEKKAQEEAEAEEGNNANKKKNQAAFEDNVKQMEVTLTLYSLERMQDPKPVLTEQDNNRP